MTSIEEALRSGAWRLVPVEPDDAMIETAYDTLVDGKDWGRQVSGADVWSAMLSAYPDHTPALLALIEERDRLKVERDGVPYGIIDPDYARVFTIARCIAWSEGYALVMHGSFTRDLDLLAVPWEDRATDAEHLVKRIASALDDLDILVKAASGRTASEKPHGRLSWTLTFKAFGDPRFIDLSVMPRAAKEERP